MPDDPVLRYRLRSETTPQVVTPEAPVTYYDVGAGGSAGPFHMAHIFFQLTDIITEVWDMATGTLEATYTHGNGATVTGTATEWGYSDGDVTLDAAVANRRVVVIRDTLIERATVFPPSGVPVDAANYDLNRDYAIMQELEWQLGTTLRLPNNQDPSDFDLSLPLPQDDYVMLWNDNAGTWELLSVPYLPRGGDANDILIKSSGSDFDWEWKALGEVVGFVFSFNGRVGDVVSIRGDYTTRLLGDIQDVAPSENDILLYQGGQWRPVPDTVDAIKLDDLLNVDTTGKQDGDYIRWNNASGKWEDFTPDGSDHDHDTDYVNVTGDTMTGPLTLSGNPTNVLHAVPQQWVSDNFAPISFGMGYLNDTDLTGLTNNEYLRWDGNDWVPVDLEGNLAGTYVELAGDTMTGPLVLSGDAAAPLNPVTKQQFDAQTHVEADITDLDRVRWLDQWGTGTYVKNDMVRDGAWTMIANKTTTDKPAPVGSGDIEWATDIYGTPSFVSEIANETVWYCGNRFTYNDSGYLHGYRFYLPDNSGDVTYEGWVAEGAEGSLIMRKLFGPVVPTNVGWFPLYETGQIIPPGYTIDVILVTRSTSLPNTLTANWNVVNANQNTPGSGECVFRNNAVEIRIHKTDADAGNQAASLEALTIGSYFSYSGSTWTITSRTDNTSYMTFGLTPNQGRPAAGLHALTFDWGSTNPLPYERDVGFWAAASNISGFEGTYYDPLNPPDPDNDCFGADLLYEGLTASDDWDVVALSGGGGGGGTSGVTSWNGRTGAVVPEADDYSLNLLQDVDLTIFTPANGHVLTYNGSVWVSNPPSGGGGSTTALMVDLTGDIDGVNKQFNVVPAAGQVGIVTMDNPLALELFIDGVRQQPFIDYNVLPGSAIITTVEAPLPGSLMWGINVDYDVPAVATRYLELEDNTAGAPDNRELETNTAGVNRDRELEVLTP